MKSKEELGNWISNTVTAASRTIQETTVRKARYTYLSEHKVS